MSLGILILEFCLLFRLFIPRFYFSLWNHQTHALPQIKLDETFSGNFCCSLTKVEDAIAPKKSFESCANDGDYSLKRSFILNSSEWKGVEKCKWSISFMQQIEKWEWEELSMECLSGKQLSGSSNWWNRLFFFHNFFFS